MQQLFIIKMNVLFTFYFKWLLHKCMRISVPFFLFLSNKEKRNKMKAKRKKFELPHVHTPIYSHMYVDMSICLHTADLCAHGPRNPFAHISAIAKVCAFRCKHPALSYIYIILFL